MIDWDTIVGISIVGFIFSLPLYFIWWTLKDIANLINEFVSIEHEWLEEEIDAKLDETMNNAWPL